MFLLNTLEANLLDNLLTVWSCDRRVGLVMLTQSARTAWTAAELLPTVTTRQGIAIPNFLRCCRGVDRAGTFGSNVQGKRPA
jgi:hypothetical protein